ncbi:TetR/AcrR family transcriptional regulator [Actinoplanes sp. NPDC051851]|uniref:TetR/AcrR family transcriptional regulator n=1 Tax=Actinoplanes sp. NPDC051851 TaxID=3154753 RepID=UPI00341A1F22
MSTPARRAPRSDALRNRERVLTAAEQVFAARGLDASLEEVAAAAGVGVGTVYRRFPSKAALLEAVFERGIDLGVELLTECRELPTGWAALTEYLRRSLLEQSGDRGLHEFLYLAEAAGLHFDRLRTRVEPLLTAIVEQAKSEGALRPDFRATDIPPLILMLSRLSHTDRVLGPPLAHRYLELLLKGLAPSPDPVPITPPIDDDTLETWFTALRRPPRTTPPHRTP